MERYMKINVTRKRLAIVILLIIVLPILYNKTSGLITGIMMQKFMKMPKEVVVDNPTTVNSNINAVSTGRVEAKYSVDLTARVSGFLL